MELAPKRWNGREDDIKRTSARFNDRDLVGTLSISTPRRSLLSTDSFSLPPSRGGSDSRFIFYRSAKERKKKRTAKWRLANFNDLNLAQIPSSLFFSSFFCSVGFKFYPLGEQQNSKNSTKEKEARRNPFPSSVIVVSTSRRGKGEPVRARSEFREREEREKGEAREVSEGGKVCSQGDRERVRLPWEAVRFVSVGKRKGRDIILRPSFHRSN